MFVSAQFAKRKYAQDFFIQALQSQQWHGFGHVYKDGKVTLWINSSNQDNYEAVKAVYAAVGHGSYLSPWYLGDMETKFEKAPVEIDDVMEAAQAHREAMRDTYGD